MVVKTSKLCSLSIWRFMLSLVLVGLFASARAQLAANITHYSTADGLSHAGVLCMLKDRDGFMWFGTFDGMNRFDGHNFVVYKSKPGDNSNLKSNKIRNIIEDKQGYLWVETYDSKIYRFDKKTEQFTPVSEGKFKNLFSDQLVINKIVADQKKGVWLLSENHGLFYVSEDETKQPSVVHYAKLKDKDKSLLGDVIAFFERDNLGNFWLGTEGGLNCLVRNKNGIFKIAKFKSNEAKLLTSGPFTSVSRKDKKMFFGTANGELVVFDTETKIFGTNLLLENTKLNAICYASSGLLYIVTPANGLLTFNPKTLKLTLPLQNTKANYLSIYEDKIGQLWIEPKESGIVKYNPKNGQYKQFVQTVDLASSSRGYEVLTDLNGILWARMKGGGFGSYNPIADELNYFYDKPGSSDQKFSNIIRSFISDDSGVLWLSARDGGINKIVLLKDKFNYRKLTSKPQARAENEVRATMKDSKGRLWICTKDGQIRVIENGINVSVFRSPINQIGIIYSILEDSKGNVWLGTKGNGLFKATPDDLAKKFYSLKHYNNDPSNVASLSHDMVYSILEDKKHRIWVGTFGGGINLLTSSEDGEAFKNYANTFKNYPFSWAKVVRHLSEDNSGRIWIATSNGLLIFDPNQTDNYQFNAYRKIRNDKSSLGNNSIQHIYKDNTGAMWLATFGGGLNRAIVDNKNSSRVNFQSFTTNDGLANDVVLSITGDRDNNLWLSTESGLSKFNTLKKTFKNFDAFDGLSKGGFSESAAFTGDNGLIYFGCIDGYIAFNPKLISEKRETAKMALTRIQLYYKDILPGAEGSPLKQSINETSSLILDYDENVISLDYAVLDYRAANKITYAYKLEGFDKSWHIVNDQRKATYTNIPPGEYTFRVKATNRDLFTQTPQKNLKIIIKSPWYATTFAYVIYFSLAVFIAVMARRIIITMIKLRNKVVVEQKLTEIKLSFFTNISHELRTPLTLIVNPLEEIAKSEVLSPAGANYLKIVNRNTNRMIRFINQLLDFRKIQSGKAQMSIAEVDVFALANSIASHFTAMAHEKNINFTIQSVSKEVFAWVDEEKIDIIIYNLLSNAFKFSPTGREIILDVNFAGSRGDVEVEVIDRGPGVPADKLEEIFEIYYEGAPLEEGHLKGTGIGLPLARGLALNHGGQLWAQNNPNGGMIFTLLLKGGTAHFDPALINFSTSKKTVKHPIIANVIPDAEIDKENNSITSGPQLLIVEDNPDLRGFLEIKLKELYRVVSAKDGIEGLELAKSLLPEIIISDVMMPRMDGIEMLNRLRNEETTSHIPVIMLTAKSSIESQLEGLKYGADIYLTKPFHTEFLLASIKNIITSRKKLVDRLIDGQEKRILNLEPSEVIITSKDETFLKQVIQIVEDGMKDPDYNIDDVATAIGMGRSTFYKKLKSLSSLSPVEFVRDMRLKRSRQLLDSGSYTISEVGYLSGFNSLPYFSTCFKEKYKVSPSAYLKKTKSLD